VCPGYLDEAFVTHHEKTDHIDIYFKNETRLIMSKVDDQKIFYGE